MGNCRFCDLKEGDSCVLAELISCPLRLQELGLLPGTDVEVVKYGPFGDTVVIQFRGSQVCLRTSEFEAWVEKRKS